MKSKQNFSLEKLLVSLFFSFCFLLIGVAVFLPALAGHLDALAYEKDVHQARNLTQAIEQHNSHEIPFENAASIQTELIEMGFSTKDFQVRSHETGLFYLPNEGTIVAKRILPLFNTQEDAFNPSEVALIGQGPEWAMGEMILLSENRSALADLVQKIHHYGKGGTSWTSHEPALISFLSTLQARIEGYLLSDTKTLAVYHTFIDQLQRAYHPETTLYVNNQRWFTEAHMGEAIQNIYFAPGITNVPPLRMNHLSLNSITFDEVLLPATVRTIEAGAFNDHFNIGTLRYLGYQDVKVEQLALTGVTHIAIETLDFDRNDPVYQIDVLFEGLPLITFDPAVLAETMSLDLSRTIRYFQSINEPITTYTIDINLSRLEASRVYVYSNQGYMGFIVPVPLSDLP